MHAGFRAAAIAVGLVAGAALTVTDANANPKYAGLVIDNNTGKILYQENANAPRYPASLTKMMTLYIVFEEIEAGRLRLDTPIRVSKHAASEPPSKLGFKPGQTITVRNAIRALVTKSANDVATAVGEHISGSESAFARRMTKRARDLGMPSTYFRNAHGLPDSQQKTTARDMARLGQALKEHYPAYFTYFSTRSFKYRGTVYSNHNRLLGRIKGVDGIKTGYIRASGFNLVTSVRRDGKDITAVVMGGRTGKSRNAHMTDLISRYLPKAKRGKRKDAQIAALPVASFPKPRPGAGTETAKPVTATGTVTPTARNRSGSAQIRSAARTPVPPASIPAGSADVDTRLTTQSISEAGSRGDVRQTPRSGWVVQVGALPSRSQADKRIAKARKSAASALKGRDGFVEEIRIKNRTHYRARFHGFSGKQQARQACATLKKSAIECFATQI